MMNKVTDDYLFDVSIVVIMYNPNWDKLVKTLDSIIIQKKISFEIVVCDDGSQEKYIDELYEYFGIKNFYAYTLIFHKHNKGTVANFCSGLGKAKGKYTKVISPGDCFTEATTLFEWIHFMEIKGAEWSFSDAYYYSLADNNLRFLKKRAFPQIISPYFIDNKNECIWNYLVLRDHAHGAAIIGTTKRQLFFCRLIKKYGVIYAEDTIWFLMMFHGIVGCYYPKESIFYEYGTGISSSGNLSWKQRLSNDMKTTYQIMFCKKKLSDFQRSILKGISKNKKVEKIFIKGKLFYWIKRNFFPRLTRIPSEDEVKNGYYKTQLYNT